MQANPSPTYSLSAEDPLIETTWATPLYDAARSGHIKVVRLLLEAHANPNEQCGWVTPLHIAAQNGLAETVQLLFDSGKILLDSTNLFRAAVRGGISIPILRMLTLAPEIHPPPVIEVGTTYAEYGEATSECYVFFNPGMQQSIGIDIMRHLDFERQIHSIALSEDDKCLAAFMESLGGVYDTKSGRQIASVNVSMEENSYQFLRYLCFSPCGSSLVGVSGDNILWLWNVASPRASTFTASYTGRINAALYTRDGRRVVTGTQDGTICIWDVSGDEHLHTHTLKIKYHVMSLSISADDEYLAISDGVGELQVWNIFLRATSTTSLGDSQGGVYISFAPDGRHLICHGYGGSVVTWEWIPGLDPDAKPRVANRHILGGKESEGVADLCVSADQRWLLSRSSVGKIIIQDAASGEVPAVLQAHAGDIRNHGRG